MRFLGCILTVWAILLALALPAHGAGEGAKITLQAEAGFEGRAKLGRWVPVTVQVTNEGPELKGALEFTSRTALGPSAQVATYQYPVVVPAGATKRFSFYMPAPLGSAPPLKLMVDGAAVAEIQPRLEITTDVLIGILGVEPAEVAPLGGLTFRQRAARLVRLTPDTLPPEVLALQNLDAILLDRAAWAELPAPQQQALQTWVEHGGVLIVAGGPEVHRLEPLFPWMGLKLQGTQRPHLDEIGTADLARFDLAGWQVTRRSGDHVLAARRARGAGTIHFLAFDPALAPFASWAGLPDLISGLLSPGTTVPADAGGTMAVQREMLLIDALSTLPLKEIPSARPLLWLLGLYALLIGPVHLLLLRSFRRLGWALLTLPLLSVAGAACVYMQAREGVGVTAVSLAVAEGQPDSTTLMVRTVAGFFLPPGSAQAASLGGALLTPLPGPPRVMPGMPNQPSGGASRVAEGRTVHLEPLESWQMRAVSAEGTVPVAATVAADLVVDGDYVKGTVTNRLPYDLDDVLVVVGPNFHPLGSLTAGQTADVSVIMPGILQQSSGPKHIAAAMARTLGLGSTIPNPRQRELMRREQMSWALASHIPWAEADDQPRVVLVGWLEKSPLPMRIDGREVEPAATTLYVQRLGYTFGAGEIVLPPDFVERRLVASPGITGPLHGGWNMRKGSTVTLAFTVPAALVDRVVELELRIPLLQRGSYDGKLPITLKLFRWSDATWVEKDFSLGAISLPAAEGFLSPEGQVRVQIGMTSEAPLVLGAPGLSVRARGEAP